MTRAWLTPDSPAPNETRCRTISVPDDLHLVAAVTGALLPLTQEENWEEQGSMTAEQAADIMSAAFEAFVSSDCVGTGECPVPTVPGTDHPFFRKNPTTGNWEQFDGENWIEPEGDYAVPELEARTEETEEDRLCAASVQAAGVIKEVYDAMLDFYQTEVDPILNQAEFALQVGIAVGTQFGNISAAYIALVSLAFETFTSAMAELTVASWSESWHQALICLLQENATDTAGVITFNVAAVNADLVGFIIPIVDENILVRWQTWYIVQFIGSEGLNEAGTTTGYLGDCAYCDGWCYEFDFLTDNGSFANVTVYNESGTIFCGSGGSGTYVGGVGWNVGRAIGRAFTRSQITSFEVDVIVATGAGSPRAGIEIYDPQGNRAYDRDYRTMTKTSDTTGTYTMTWSGDVMGSQIALIRCTSSGTTNYRRLRIFGLGTNPFGTDNCP